MSLSIGRCPHRPFGDGAGQIERGPVELALDGDVGRQLFVRIPGGGHPEAGGHLGEDGTEGRLVASGGTDVAATATATATATGSKRLPG